MCSDVDHLFHIQLHFRDDMLFVISEYSLQLGFWIVLIIMGKSLYRGSLQRVVFRSIYCSFRQAQQCCSLYPGVCYNRVPLYLKLIFYLANYSADVDLFVKNDLFVI